MMNRKKKKEQNLQLPLNDFEQIKKSSRKYQTASEPFHTHGTDVDKMSNVTRYPNFEHQNLRKVMEAIFFHRVMSESENKIKEKKK
ncbi:hypothetical protein SM124_16185 [Bacillus sp. 31A1R]|uniref:Uncharacterized protein n=1 Tax=Robertmurraya mangrovi TaxID=3098077 RepID=A0ABU5J1N2_9BACI|nr:hypothetical protein [Bacillus sp. 31A1R]MDZ5473257.1 hypothetical protein [Bacillus sp. 31A1R]